MTMLQTYLLLLLGVVMYFFVNSFRFIVRGKFKFQEWKQTNLMRLCWTIGLIHLMCLAHWISPSSTTKGLVEALKFIGIPVTTNPLWLGVIMAGSFKSIQKAFSRLDSQAAQPNQSQDQDVPNPLK